MHIGPDPVTDPAGRCGWRRACGWAGPPPWRFRDDDVMPIEPSAGPGASTAREVAELWQRVAEERGLDFLPAPRTVAVAIPDLVRVVDDVAAGLVDAQERRWLAALLAALSHHVEVSTLDDPPARNWLSSEGDLAVVVVTGRNGVLVGRYPDPILRWVLPGGWIEGDDTPGEAAVRECAEKTGLHVTAEQVIGQRRHPETSEMTVYVACSPVAGTAVRVAAPEDAVEMRWVEFGEVETLVPDLCDAVRDYLASCAGERRH